MSTDFQNSFTVRLRPESLLIIFRIYLATEMWKKVLVSLMPHNVFGSVANCTPRWAEDLQTKREWNSSSCSRRVGTWYTGCARNGATDSWPVNSSTDLRNYFTGRLFGKFAIKWISKIPSHLACVATLPCEILMSAKRAINDKLQGSVAT